MDELIECYNNIYGKKRIKKISLETIDNTYSTILK